MKVKMKDNLIELAESIAPIQPDKDLCNLLEEIEGKEIDLIVNIHSEYGLYQHTYLHPSFFTILPTSPMAVKIMAECDAIKNMLLEKNASYGNAAADPVRIFSKADPVEQINVRLDDKLSRLMRGGEFPGDDTELDLIGYMILKRIVSRSPE